MKKPSVPKNKPVILDWSQIEDCVALLHPELANAINEAIPVTKARLRLLFWHIALGDALVQNGKLHFEETGVTLSLFNAFRRFFPLIFVISGCIEVSDGEEAEPKYVARSGQLIGLFEVVCHSTTTEFDLYASFRSPLVLPPVEQDKHIAKWCDTTDYEVGLIKRAQINTWDLFEVIRKLVKQKNTKKDIGASIIAFPFEWIQEVIHDNCLNQKYLSLRSIFWREAADSYRYAYDTLKEEHKLLLAGSQELVPFINDLLSREIIVWTAPNHLLPANCGLSSSDFLHAIFQGDSKGVLLKRRPKGVSSDTYGPVVLFPAHLNWSEVGWGVLHEKWTKRAKTMLDRFKGTSRHVRGKDGTGWTLYTKEDWDKAVNLLQELLRCSESGLDLTDQAREWGKLVDFGSMAGQYKRRYVQYMDLIFVTKPDILIDFTFSRLRELCISNEKELHVTAIQHIIRCNVRLLGCLITAGLAKDVAVMGKGYSSSYHSILSLEDMDVRVFTESSIPPLGKWDIAFRENASQFWSSRDKSLGTDSLQILVDDGGCLHQSAMADQAHMTKLIAGIEQTGSGIKLIRDMEFKYPIVDVAGSWVKRHFESPLIQFAIMERCERYLAMLVDEYVDRKVRVAVIGGRGAIGQHLMGYREHGITPKEFDLGSDLSDALEMDVIFGCTGCDVFAGVEELQSILSSSPGTRRKYFISCSSGDVEFRSLLKLADNPTSPCLPPGEVSLCGQKAIILKSGFPVNFDNSEFSVPMPYISLTTMLMAAGIYQAGVLAITSAEPGLYELSPEIQAAILHFWLRSIFDRDKHDEQMKDVIAIFNDYKSVTIKTITEKIRKDTPAGRTRRLESAAQTACQNLAEEITIFSRLIRNAN